MAQSEVKRKGKEEERRKKKRREKKKKKKEEAKEEENPSLTSVPAGARSLLERGPYLSAVPT